MLDEEVSPQYKVEGFDVHHVEPMGNAPSSHGHVNLAVPTTVQEMTRPHANCCGRHDVFQVPQR